MMHEKPEKSIEQIITEDGRYPLAAVQFVREGLNHTLGLYYPEKEPGRKQHVTGPQLCEGLRDLAIKRWGLMARSVLASWSITATRDFGEIVFILVNSGWMQKNEEDTVEDFDEVFDFETIFEKQFEVTLE